MNFKASRKKYSGIRETLRRASKKTERWSERVPFAGILLFAVLFFVVLAFVLPIQFEENDDISMLLIASGRITGSPDGHLVFINYVFGYPLSRLYALFPRMEWYTLSFSLVHILSTAVILRHFLRKEVSLFERLSLILLFLSFCALFIARFQFTTTAGLSALAGIILMLDEKSKSGKACGVLLFFLGFLIRSKAALLVLALVSPLFVKLLLHDRRRIAVLGLAVALSLAGYGLNYLSYQNDTWSYYYEYNRIRGRLNDNPNVLKNYDLVQDRIDKAELTLFMKYLPDGQQIDLDFLRHFHSLLSPAMNKPHCATFFDLLKLHRNRFMLLSLIFLLTLFAARDRLGRIILIAGFVWFWLIMLGLSQNYTLKIRVLNTSILALVFFFTEIPKKGFSRTGLKSMLIPLCFVVLTLFTLKATQRARTTNAATRCAFRREWKAICESPYRILPVGLHFHGQHPFRVSAAWPEGKILIFGWFTHYPADHSVLPNYLELTRDVAIFIRDEQIEKKLPLIRSLILKNYGLETAIVREDVIPGYALKRIVPCHTETKP